MQNNIPVELLKQMAASAIAHDFDAHMNLISKSVQVFGVPGFDVIGYDDWSTQCEHEFKEKLIKNVSYEGMKQLSETSDKIMFKTIETIETTDNNINTSGIEVIIEKEDDEVWRVTQERILSDEELAHDRSRGYNSQAKKARLFSIRPGVHTFLPLVIAINTAEIHYIFLHF